MSLVGGRVYAAGVFQDKRDPAVPFCRQEKKVKQMLHVKRCGCRFISNGSIMRTVHRYERKTFLGQYELWSPKKFQIYFYFQISPTKKYMNSREFKVLYCTVLEFKLMRCKCISRLNTLITLGARLHVE